VIAACSPPARPVAKAPVTSSAPSTTVSSTPLFEEFVESAPVRAAAPTAPVDPAELRLELRVDEAVPDRADPHRFVVKTAPMFHVRVALAGSATRSGSFAPLVRRTGDYGIAIAFDSLEGSNGPPTITVPELAAGKLYANVRVIGPEPDAGPREDAAALTAQFVKMSREVKARGGQMSDEDKRQRDALLARMSSTGGKLLPRFRPGRYRVTADYVSGGAGRWQGRLQAQPIEIVIRD
jgi:hypothetical protein